MEKILIFFSIGIGDALMALPSVREFVSGNEKEFYAFTLSPVVKEIAEKSCLFKKVFYIDFFGQNKIKSFLEILRIRKNRFEKGILLFPSNHFVYRIVLKLLCSGRLYFHQYIRREKISLNFLASKTIEQSGKEHSTVENFKLLEAVFGISKKRDYGLFLPGEVVRNKQNRFTIGIHAGSDTLKNLSCKRWPYFKELVAKINEEADVDFYLFGNSSEYDLNDSIAEGFNNVFVVKEKKFFDSVGMISKCDIFISNDSGLLHTAAALSIPTISIFGPTNEKYTAPLNKFSVVITNNISCRPCYEYSKEMLVCKNTNKYECIRDISPDIVKLEFFNLFEELKKINLNGKDNLH
ncbi:MAG: glycosyltransferase family 9 protein [Candidatus Delongbacteria bacterium]|nr:glycosyltransferase family 9 protein [Candidatus Delongbacteria bacterium]MBN2834972.1 glycosyltransferase family 9 protein [Candidatus Delongbacteria bacterium]